VRGGSGAAVAVVLCCVLAGALFTASASAGDVADSAAAAAKPKGGKMGKGGKGKKPKGGREGRAAGELKRTGCPTYRAITERKYSSKVRQAARRWKFEVFHFNVRLKPPIDWAQNPFGSRSYRQNLHGWIWIDTLLYSYMRTGDEGLLRQARDIALDWIKSNPRQFRPGLRGFAWHPKAAADRAGYLGFLTGEAGCKGLLNRKQAQLMVRSLNAHGRYLANAAEHQDSNFGLFQDLGLLLVSQYLPFEREAERWRKLAVRRFPETLMGRLSPEWVWREHSTQYQFLAIELLRDFLKYKSGEQRDPALVDTLARMRDATGWFVDPERQYALLGDTQFAKAPEWGYNKGGSYKSQGLKAFRESGFAMVRQGGSYLATTAGFFNTTHKHSDELDFELYDRGLKIVNGPGNYGYDREDQYRDYQLSGLSHSVLLVDGQSFPIEAENAYGSAIRATGQGAGWFAIDGTNPLTELQGVSHSRLFLYKPGNALVVVDRLRADAAHAYQRFFQLGPDLEIQGLSPGTLGLSGPGFSGGLYERAAATGGASRTVVKGRPAPLQGFTFPGFRQAVPRWSIEYGSRAADANYITVFTLNGVTQSGTVSVPAPGTTEVVLTRGSSSQTITVKRSGSRLTLDFS
jgi:Heparinase II/III-like protein/Heparinase II/III N-terminus